NGDVHIVPSGDVRLVTNKSKGWTLVSIDAGIAYSTPVERALEVLERYCLEVARDDEIADALMEPPTVAGVNAFQDHQYIARVNVKLVPSADSKPIERQMRRILRRVFEEEGIEAPMPLLLKPMPSSVAAGSDPAASKKPPASPTEA
ncbi:MAG: hypothetical protein ACRDYF_00025, partial [Acidimicrobiia bacterium]